MAHLELRFNNRLNVELKSVSSGSIYHPLVLTHPLHLMHYSHESAKSGSGRSNPFDKYRATQTPHASFFVSGHRTIVRSDNRRPASMVALTGQPKGWPVPLYAGIATPVSVTTNHERSNSGGDSFSPYKEIASMAVNASTRLKTYLFAAIDRANLKAKAPVMLRVCADSERSARAGLVGRYVLSFAGVIQNGGAC